MPRRNIKGFIDPISIIGVLMLVITLIVGTAVTTNKDFSLNIVEQAAGTKKTGNTAYDKCREDSGRKTCNEQLGINVNWKGEVVNEIDTSKVDKDAKPGDKTCDANGVQYSPGAVVLYGGIGSNAKCGSDGRWETYEGPITDVKPENVPEYAKETYKQAVEKKEADEAKAAQQQATEPVAEIPVTTTTPAVTVTIDDDESRNKSVCLQEGGFWENSACSYKQQNQAITQTVTQIQQNQEVVQQPVQQPTITTVTTPVSPFAGVTVGVTGKTIPTTPIIIKPKYESKSDCEASTAPNTGAFRACGQYASQEENKEALMKTINPLIKAQESYKQAVDNPYTYAGCQTEGCNITKNLIDNFLIADSYKNYWQEQSAGKDVTITGAAAAIYKAVTPDVIADKVLKRAGLLDEADNYLDIAFNQKTVLDTADTVFFDKFTPYVSNYQRINAETYDPNRNAVANYLDAYVTGGLDAETRKATVDLGLVIEAELAMAYALPVIAGSTGLLPAAGATFGQFGAITTSNQIINASEECIRNGVKDEQCLKDSARAAFSLLTLGTSQAANTITKLAGYSDEAVFLARGANTIVSAGNLAVDSGDVIDTCTKFGSNQSSFGCTMSYLALVGDIAGGAFDYKQGQLGFSGSKPDIPDINGTRIANAEELALLAKANSPDAPKPEIPMVEIPAAKLVKPDNPLANVDIPKALDTPSAPKKTFTELFDEKITNPIINSPVGDFLFGKPVFLDNLDTPLPPTVRGNAPVMIKPIEIQATKTFYAPELDPALNVKNVYKKYGDILTAAYENKDADALLKLAKEKGYKVELVEMGSDVHVIENGHAEITPLKDDNSVRISADGKTLYVGRNPDNPSEVFDFENLSHDINAILLGGKTSKTATDIPIATLADYLQNTTGQKFSTEQINQNIKDSVGTYFTESGDEVIPDTWLLDSIVKKYIPARTLDNLIKPPTFIEKYVKDANGWLPWFSTSVKPVSLENLEPKVVNVTGNIPPPTEIKIPTKIDVAKVWQENIISKDGVILPKLNKLPNEKLARGITGLDIGDPELMPRLIDDHYIIKAKYNLPPREMRFDNPREYINRLNQIAKDNGVEIRNVSEWENFFETNRAAAAFDDKGNQLFVNFGEEASNPVGYAGNLEHELIHGLQHKSYPGMPIEVMEYETYVTANMSLNNKIMEPVNFQIAVFENIKQSVDHWYTEKGLTNPWIQKTPAETAVSWVQNQVNNVKNYFSSTPKAPEVDIPMVEIPATKPVKHADNVANVASEKTFTELFDEKIISPINSLLPPSKNDKIAYEKALDALSGTNPSKADITDALINNGYNPNIINEKLLTEISTSLPPVNNNVEDVVSKLNKLMDRIYPESPNLPECRAGLCGWVSDDVETAFKYNNFKTTQYQVTDLNTARGIPSPETNSFKHAITVVEDDKGNKYLIDLTFSQFINKETGIIQHPTTKINTNFTIDNPVAKEIFEKGYIKLDDNTLNEYLNLMTSPDVPQSKVNLDILDQTKARREVPKNTPDEIEKYYPELVNQKEILPTPLTGISKFQEQVGSFGQKVMDGSLPTGIGISPLKYVAGGIASAVFLDDYFDWGITDPVYDTVNFWINNASIIYALSNDKELSEITVANPNQRPYDEIIQEAIGNYTTNNSNSDVYYTPNPQALSLVDIFKQLFSKDSLDIISSTLVDEDYKKLNLSGKIMRLSNNLLTDRNSFIDSVVGAAGNIGLYTKDGGTYPINGFDNEVKSLVVLIEEEFQATGRPVSHSFVIEYFLQKNNGDLAQSILDSSNFEEFLLRSSEYEIVGEPYVWIQNHILDEYSPLLPYQRLPDQEDKLENSTIYYDYSLPNRLGEIYHAASITALLNYLPPEIIRAMVFSEYLSYGDKHGLIKMSADLEVLKRLDNINDLLNSYK